MEALVKTLKLKVMEFLSDKLVIGVDPGGNTGYVEVSEGVLVRKQTLEIQQVWALLNSGTWFSGSILVIEDYMDYQSSRGGNAFNRAIPAQIIGAFKCHNHRSEYKLVLQHANKGKQTCPNELLDVIFDTKGFTKHEKDALRHVVSYALTQIGTKITNEVQ